MVQGIKSPKGMVTLAVRMFVRYQEYRIQTKILYRKKENNAARVTNPTLQPQII
jgi:hypothetical protein